MTTPFRFKAFPPVLLFSAMLAGCLLGTQKEARRGSIIENETTVGYLYLEDGTPARGARVKIVPVGFAPEAGAASDSIFTDRTDSVGRFSVDSVPDGKYNVLADLDGVFAFRDSLELKEGGDSLPSDTLKEPGSLLGRVEMEPNHDLRSVTIQVLGTDRYFNVDEDGEFILSGMAQGRYGLRLATTEESYTDLFASVSIQSGEADTLADTLRLTFTGLPVVRAMTVSYDTLKGIATLTWTPVDYAQLSAYLIYRNPASDVLPSAEPIARLTDTIFLDTLFDQEAASGSLPLNVDYRVRVLNKSDEVGLNFGFVSLTAPPPSAAKTVTTLSVPGSTAAEAGIGDSVEVLAKYRNDTRKIRRIRWYAGSAVGHMRETVDSSFSGRDSVKVTRPDAGNMKIRVEIETEDGNVWRDSLIVSFLLDLPVAKASSNTVSTQLTGSPLSLSAYGSSDRFGTLVKWEWDVGGTGDFIPVSKGDTVVTAPSMPDSGFRCILRVTDDDGLVALDTLRIAVVNWEWLPSAVNWGGIGSLSTAVLNGAFYRLEGDGEVYATPLAKLDWTMLPDAFPEYTQIIRKPLVVVDGKLVAIRGTANGSQARIWTANEAAWIPKASNSVLQETPNTAVIEKKVYLIGDNSFFDVIPNDRKKRMQIYDAEQDSWSLGTTLPCSTYFSGGFSTVTLDGRIYLLITADSNETQNGSLYVYDPPSNAWSVRSKRVSKSNSSVLDLIEWRGKIVVAIKEPTGVHLEFYDPVSNRWDVRATAAFPLHLGKLLPFGESLWLFSNPPNSDGRVIHGTKYDPAADAWTSGPPIATPPESGWGPTFPVANGDHVLLFDYMNSGVVRFFPF